MEKDKNINGENNAEMLDGEELNEVYEATEEDSFEKDSFEEDIPEEDILEEDSLEEEQSDPEDVSVVEVPEKRKKKKEKEPKEKSAEDENGEEADEKETKKRFYTELWFILTLSGVAIVTLFVILVSVARSGGSSWSNLFGKDDKELDFINDSLDAYINIKESDYKNYEIAVPMLRPTEANVRNEINKAIAQNRGEYEGTFVNSKISVGDDVKISYLGYQTDDVGRKFLVSGASNYSKANTDSGLEKITVGLNSSVFGIGFDESLVGKQPNGRLVNARDYGAVFENNVIYATTSFVLNNGLVYDEVQVCIDPKAENFEKCWGIGMYEHLLSKCDNLGLLMIRGDNYITLPLEGGGRITYTSFKVDYVTEANSAPITVQSSFGYDYEVQSLRNQKIFYDLYIDEKIDEYQTFEFDESFVKDKLGLTEEKLAIYDGENLVEKCENYYMNKLISSYDSVCRSYVEIKVWERLNSLVRIEMYPQSEVDRIYLDLVEGYTKDLAAENATGAQYAGLDEYMVDVLELGEGAEWTGYLLEIVKSTVKERLIAYAVLRNEGILPVGDEFNALYEKELQQDYEYANAAYPGTFKTLDEFRQYIAEEEGADYIHTVYYYYATEKLMEMVTIKYPE